MVKVDKELLFVVYIGLGFCSLQIAFLTIFNVQEYIFRSVQLEDPTFTVSSYYCWCIQFFAASITCLFSATITNKCGPRLTLFIGGVFHLFFNLQFLHLIECLVYFGNFMRGIANALTITSVGRYITENSTKHTIVRNSGIYYMVIQINRFIGNTYILLRFKDEHFRYEERMEFYGAWATACFIGCIIFGTLPLALYNKPVTASLKESLMLTFRQFVDKDSLFLMVQFFYVGMQFTFGAGIYINCLGFTTGFSFGFCCMHAAFLTIFNVQEFIFRSAQIEDSTFTTSSYYCWGIQFLASSITCIFSATITNKCGPRLTLFIGAVFHLIFNLQFLYLNQYLIYFGSCMRGIANALTFTAAGRYITENCTKDTIVRNCGIYLMVVQCSRLIGNAYVLLRFKNEHFRYEDRMEFYGAMAVICFLACIIFGTLPLALFNKPVTANLRESLMLTIRQFFSMDSLYSLPQLFYVGMQFGIGSGMYSNCLGFSTGFSFAPMTRMAISGLFNGLGGITAGLTLGILGRKVKVKGHIIILCFLLQLINITLISLNLPNSCPIKETNDRGFMTNDYIAHLSSYIFGFIDTAIYSMQTSLFAFIFKNTIAEAHAVFRIVIGIAIGVVFVVTPYLRLYGVIIALIVINLLGVISFCMVEGKHIALQQKQEEVKEEHLNIVLAEEIEAEPKK